MGDGLEQWAVVQASAHLAIVRRFARSFGVNLPDGSPLPNDVDKAAEAARAAKRDDVSAFELALAIHHAVLAKLSHTTSIVLPAEGQRIPEVHVRSEACYENLGLRFIERAGLSDGIRIAVDDIAAQIAEHERALASIPKMEAFANDLVAKLASVPTPNAKPWKLFASCVPKVRSIVLHFTDSHLDAVAKLCIDGGEPFVRVRKWRAPLAETSADTVVEHVKARLAVLTIDRLVKKKKYRVREELEGCSPGETLTFLGTVWEHDRFAVFRFGRENGESVVLRDSAITDDLDRYLEPV